MEEEQNKCQLCGNKGAEIDLQSIPIVLPSYLPKIGKVHLSCLEIEVHKHIPDISNYKFTFLFCFNFIICSLTGFFLMYLYNSPWPIIIGLFLIWLIPMLYFFIPYSKVRHVLKWIKIMAKKQGENEADRENNAIE